MNDGAKQILAQGHPRYMALAQSLINDISSGKHPVGTLLPTEFELCDRFAVSRHTVREAIRRLADLGMVTRQPGVGTRVRAQTGTSRYVHSNEGVADLFQYVRDVHLILDRQSEIIADEALAELLECKPGQAWLLVEGERHVEGEDGPIAATKVFIAWPYRDVLKGVVAPDQPIYSMIEKGYGCVANEVNQHVSAVLLDAASAKKLDVEPGVAALKVVRKYRNASGEVYEVAVNLHPGDRFTQSMTLRLETRSVEPMK